jgi:hypothetical protein
MVSEYWLRKRVEELEKRLDDLATEHAGKTVAEKTERPAGEDAPLLFPLRYVMAQIGGEKHRGG